MEDGKEILRKNDAWNYSRSEDYVYAVTCAELVSIVGWMCNCRIRCGGGGGGGGGGREGGGGGKRGGGWEKEADEKNIRMAILRSDSRADGAEA